MFQNTAHQMVPTFQWQIKNLGFKDIKTTELAYFFTNMKTLSQNMLKH